MATALIGGLLKSGWPRADLRVVEIAAEARERLERELEVTTYADAASAAPGASCIVLAVKPQHVRAVARSLAPHISTSLVVTIAAGIRLGDLSRWLGGHPRVVRAMPNTPALVLAGITGLYAPPTLDAADRAQAERILGVAGATLWVEREEQMDAVTAISGSGPAYVFYFIEALQQSAAALGFAPADARRLAIETFRGAVKLAAEGAEEPATLRARVTSKGGTTERALAALEHHGVRDAVLDAARAAAERSRELGEELGKDA
jgi:pyrroline-5-carboxylate reductase